MGSNHDRQVEAEILANRPSEVATLTDVLAEALDKGMAKAADAGYTKPFDIAAFVKSELRALGFKLVRIPRKGGK